MPRKSTYDRLVDAISKRISEMAPEKCQTIEEAVHNDQTLSGAFGMMPSSVEDYTYCPTCNRVCWHGVCRVCE